MWIHVIEEFKKIQDSGELDELWRDAKKQSKGQLQLFISLIVDGLEKRLKMDAGKEREQGNNRREKEESKKPGSHPSSSSSTTGTCYKYAETNFKKRRSCEDGQNKGKEKKTKVVKLDGVPREPPEGVMAIVRERQGTNPVLVIKKDLTNTDLSKNHSRLSMPEQKVNGEFLNGEERWNLDHVAGYRIKVSLVEPRFFEVSEMEVRKWKGSYVVTCGWGALLRRYNKYEKYRGVLCEGINLQVWSFRCNSGNDLWLALVV